MKPAEGHPFQARKRWRVPQLTFGVGASNTQLIASAVECGPAWAIAQLWTATEPLAVVMCRLNRDLRAFGRDQAPAVRPRGAGRPALVFAVRVFAGL